VHRIADHAGPTGNAVRHAEAPVRILVVDADDDTRALYRESLALLGCEVMEASDGRDALVKALAAPPTLVVTEVRLPFVDGFGLCDILRHDHATADVPILVVTGEARPAEIDRARRMGADTVLVKPITPEHMAAETRRLIANAEEMRRAALIRAASDLGKRAQSAQRRAGLSKSLARVTTTAPPSSPPALMCPSCDGPLIYEQSYVGGVSERHPEQWDQYACRASCGTFEYRHRTRKLRFVE
jgi:CheY-like chemotaxis protein